MCIRDRDITVRELTEMADLNRGTFYLHYKDVFDLLEQTETELLGKLNSVIQKHRAEELSLIHIFYIFFTFCLRILIIRDISFLVNIVSLR